MSATDELRKMLDERGMEWTASGTDTCWTSADGYPMRAWDTTNGTHMRVADLTPEQAITATLGAGMCRNVSDPPEGFLCSECGWGDFAEPSHLLTGSCYVGLAKGPRYCPNCGRKVEG